MNDPGCGRVAIAELTEYAAGELPEAKATELESFRTTVWPTFNKETGKIESVRFTVPFESEEGAADKLMATMKKVWGEPKEEEKYGNKIWVFSEEPFITVEDSIGRAWEIEKKAKRD